MNAYIPNGNFKTYKFILYSQQQMDVFSLQGDSRLLHWELNRGQIKH